MTAQQLKNSILQMAVQGKLVPQDPNDEPASVLLERIRAEKERLIKEKKIKREKNPSFIFKGTDNTPYEKIGDEVRSLADEVPFDIPDSWEWVRVRNCTELFNGRAFKPSDWTVMGLPIVRIQNLNDEKAPFNYYDKSVDEDVHLYGGELLFAWSGTPGTSFGAHIWRDQEAVLNQHIFKLLFDENALFKPYYMYALNQRVGSLIKAAHGSAGLQHVTRGVFESTLIPLPPFAEQIRIVEKLNVLFPIVDHYSSAYDNLNNLQSAFPEALKKSILHEAVRGKLVPQNPNEEPASVLLERIRAEKQRLIKEGKIKKDKHESIIFRRDNSHYEKLDGVERCIDDELPFEIPETWEWVRLGTVFQHNTGKALNASNRDGEKLTYITTSNLYWDRFVLDNLKTMPFTDSEVDKCTVQQGDLLVCEGGDIGRAAIWESGEPMRIQNHIHRLRAYVPVCTRFFYYLFYLYKGAGWIGGKGIAIQGLSSNAIHNLLFPLPPLHEQERIVSSIDTALSIVQEL